MNIICNEEIFNNGNIVLMLNGVSGIVRNLLNSKGIKFKELNNSSLSFDFYVPIFKDNKGMVHCDVKYLTNDYLEHMDKLYDKYLYYVGNGVNSREASYILPMALKKDLIINCSKEQIVKFVNSLVESNITELIELREQLIAVINKYYPSLNRLIINDRDDSTLLEIENTYNNPYTKMFMYDRKRLDRVNLITESIFGSSLSSSECNICVYYLMKKYNLTYEVACQNASRLTHDNPSIRKKIIDWMIRYEEDDLLEQINYRFEIPSSLTALQELSEFGLSNYSVTEMDSWDVSEYYLPESLSSLGAQKLLLDSIEMMKYLKDGGVRKEDLVYLFTNANIVNLLVNISARDMIRLCNNGCCELNGEEVKSILDQMVKIAKNKTSLLADYYGATCETIRKCNSEKRCERSFEHDCIGYLKEKDREKSGYSLKLK